MIKLLGAGLVVSAASMVGIRMALAVRREESILRQFQNSLEIISCEVGGKLTPVPDLCKLLAAVLTAPLADVYREAARRFEMQLDANTEQVFCAILKTWQDNLPASVYQLLQQLGQNLGQFDAPEQLQMIQALQIQTKHILAQMQEEKGARCRSYEVLGVCAGCALAIILI